ncbi:nitrate/sulfonate/bicarbonate ABC transporter periplasmic protein [Klebsiella pneumoniae]|uniref:Putative aliphatic sulfonates-binding protein n=1 Tax=Klebsiella pneumoniae TaxID=573 RepID=A0A2X3IUR3_KLEPN|nr:nitrate/sulfonate/bicarbonate ABC transporter periplasmic protein [Klebsiella pneumoniae]
MRLSFSGRVAAALMLLALGGYATAQERLTLRIADQKGGMRSQLEAANALQNLPYDIKWAEFPAAAPLAEALNAGAVDAGIIGDAPLPSPWPTVRRSKLLPWIKATRRGPRCWYPPAATLKSGADLKGKRIATGKGSIGHFVALKALEQAGISPKEVQWVFLGPVDAKVALLNGSVDAWATWEPYTTQMVKTNEGQILVSGKGLLPGIPSSRQRIPRLTIRQKRAAAAGLSPAPGRRRALGLRQSRQLRQNVGGDHPLPGGDRPRAVCQPPVAVAAAGRGNSGPAAGNGGTLSRQRPDPHPAGREADL